jgi:hypothetical protein
MFHWGRKKVHLLTPKPRAGISYPVVNLYFEAIVRLAMAIVIYVPVKSKRVDLKRIVRNLKVY